MRDDSPPEVPMASVFTGLRAMVDVVANAVRRPRARARDAAQADRASRVGVATREDRELAERQQEVAKNRRLMRAAEARGERWTGPREPALFPLKVLTLGLATVVIGVVVTAFLRGRLVWPGTATKQIPTSETSHTRSR